jgi:[ribosomal protein S5]-alanine N-acetyltransferase
MTIIKTKDFILRPIELKDTQGYWEVMQDEETKKGFRSVPNSFEEAKKEVEDLIKNTKTKISETFTIDIDGEYAGNVKLDCQDYDINTDAGRIHLWLHPKFRGKGIATNALRELIKYGFTKRGFKVIYAQCKKSNIGVCKINQKLGFRLIEERNIEGTIKLWWEIYWHQFKF